MAVLVSVACTILCGEDIDSVGMAIGLWMGGGERRMGMAFGVGSMSALPARDAVATAGVLWPRDKQRRYPIRAVS
jgi:hypothetical protein